MAGLRWRDLREGDVLVYPLPIAEDDGVYLLLEDARVVKGKVCLRVLCLPSGEVYLDTQENVLVHPRIEVWRA